MYVKLLLKLKKHNFINIIINTYFNKIVDIN